jgi:hypothetical protein
METALRMIALTHCRKVRPQLRSLPRECGGAQCRRLDLRKAQFSNAQRVQAGRDMSNRLTAWKYGRNWQGCYRRI